MITPGLDMRLWIGRCLAAVLFLAGIAVFGLAQSVGRGGGGEGEVYLPGGKNQKDEIAKSEHRQNLKDAAELAELADQLKIELEKNDRYVVSMATIKKTE